MPPRHHPTLAEIGEDPLVSMLTASLPTGKDVIVGPGDDCAVLRSSKKGFHELLKTDCVVEGVHYLADSPAAKVGHKALARTISDIAAMGGRPKHALITLILPPDRELRYAKHLYRGLTKCADTHGVSIVGGETARPDKNGSGSISVMLTGEVRKEELCLRSGGEHGDLLYVTGCLGGSIRGHHLNFIPRLEHARWLAARHKPSAMMDLSDGIAADLPRLAKASNCGYQLNLESLPRRRSCSIEQALGDGEDYELLFAVPAKNKQRLERGWRGKFPDVGLRQIGQLAAKTLRSPDFTGGWQHF